MSLLIHAIIGHRGLETQYDNPIVAFLLNHRHAAADVYELIRLLIVSLLAPLHSAESRKIRPSYSPAR